MQTQQTTKQRGNFSHIRGWGADLDHRDRPAYPMERMPPRLDNVHWDQPEQQPVRMKIYHSTERPGITPVFGTSVPPSGLSGKIRDFAYTYSENDLRHWLLLMFADRINVLEGIGQDIRSGQIPNLFAEMGMKAEMRHNPTGMARKVLIASAAIGLGMYLIKRRR